MHRSEKKAKTTASYVNPLDLRSGGNRTSSSNGKREDSESEVANDGDQTSIMPLTSIMREPLLLLHFRRYAGQHFDAEAVHFLLTAQIFYKRMQSSTLNLNQLIEELDAICEKYIQQGAAEQVNISSALRSEALEQVQALRFVAISNAKARLKPASVEMKAQSRECLQKVVMEVYSLVQLNSYPRFLNSSALSRLHRLMEWCDEFLELDSDEQTATILKLRDAQARAMKQSDDTQLHSRSGGTLLEQDQQRKKAEAQLTAPHGQAGGSTRANPPSRLALAASRVSSLPAGAISPSGGGGGGGGAFSPVSSNRALTSSGAMSNSGPTVTLHMNPSAAPLQHYTSAESPGQTSSPIVRRQPSSYGASSPAAAAAAAASMSSEAQQLSLPGGYHTVEVDTRVEDVDETAPPTKLA